jgi:hypothetical protein
VTANQTKNYGWAGWSQTTGNQATVPGSGLDSPIRLERGTDNTVRIPVQDSHGNITKVINGGSGGPRKFDDFATILCWVSASPGA